MPPREYPQPALGAAIRTLRTRAGLSQEELAHRADLHPTWVSHLESGRRNPAWSSMQRLAKALDTSVAEIAAVAEAGETDTQS